MGLAHPTELGYCPGLPHWHLFFASHVPIYRFLSLVYTTGAPRLSSLDRAEVRRPCLKARKHRGHSENCPGSARTAWLCQLQGALRGSTTTSIMKVRQIH